MDMSVIDDRKARARGWFEALRNDICAAFERLEDDAIDHLHQWWLLIARRAAGHKRIIG